MSASGIGILVALLAWGTVLLPMPGWLRFILCMTLGFAGALLVIFGGFAYWWDGSMQPSKRTAMPMVCGFIALAALFKPLWASFERESR